MLNRQKLTLKRQLERLHMNVNNITMDLLNLDPFLTEIRGLVKEIMLTVADGWDIMSPIPPATLTRKDEKRGPPTVK